MQETLGSGAVCMHTCTSSGCGRNSALPAYRAEYKASLLSLLGQTGDICHPVGVLISSAGWPHVAKQCIICM